MASIMVVIQWYNKEKTMGNVMKEGKGQKPIGGGPAPLTPQPTLPRSGSTVVDAAQAVVGNSSGGSSNSATRCMKDRPGSCSSKKG